MSAIQTTSQPVGSQNTAGVSGWVKRHPLVAYFALAYAVTWILIVPILLSQRGFGLLALPDALLLVFFIVSTFAGPFGAALIVTGITEGRAGVRLLLRRIVQWRVGLVWYLIPILGYPLLFVVAYSFVLGTEPLTAFIQKWPLFLTSYLPAILYGMILPSLGEEPGWRGFALPRLQLRYGALAGTLILGTLHAFWHLPVYFVPGAILPGPFDLTAFIANSFAIIAETILWTWIFNNARGSILIAMLFHGASNAFSGYFPQLLTVPDDLWATFKIFGVCALLLIILTRGRLSYNPRNAPQAPSPPPQARAPEG
jgi:membrane protease YdiL (CAAX protease family)